MAAETDSDTNMQVEQVEECGVADNRSRATVRLNIDLANRAILQFVAWAVQLLSALSTFSSTGHTWWPQLERTMKISNTTRLASITLAALLTVVTNGSMLMSFNAVAQSASAEQSLQAPTLVTLNTVTVVANHA